MREIIEQALQEAFANVEYSEDIQLRLKLLKAEKEIKKLKTDDK